MKRSLAFLAVGASWILFCGLVGLEFTPAPNDGRQVFTPSPPFILERPVPEKSSPSFFSALDERWRADRLLAASA